MEEKYQIFMPEWVPLENKGEEAIVRGMADVIFPEGDVAVHILDMFAKSPYSVDGLYVYPGTWFYSSWRSQEFRPGLRPREIYASGCSVLRHALNRMAPNWVRLPQGPVRRLEKLHRRMESRHVSGRVADAFRRILACDFLIAGHDGAFDEYDCHIMNMMHRLGMRHGIFGSSMKVNVTSPGIISLFHETLRNSDFIFCRNRRAYEWASTHFDDLDVQLAPDPAFGMIPASPNRAEEIIRNESLEDLFTRPVVMVTSAEPAPIARHSFESISGRPGKLRYHHRVLAELVSHITDNCGANVLFLPHTIGPTQDLDDRLVAEKVVRNLPHSGGRVRILKTDLPARDLKALIGRAELLVGERIHSLIGAVGMHTPFLCLGVKQDNRVSMIIGEMCKSADKIHFLNDTDAMRVIKHFDSVWQTRAEHRRHLDLVSSDLHARLGEVGSAIRHRIDATVSKKRHPMADGCTGLRLAGHQKVCA